MKSIVTLCALFLSVSFTFAADPGGKPPGGHPGRPPGGGPPEEGGKARPNREEIFKKLDSNSDGAISKEEFDAGPMAKNNPDRAAKVFEERDKDKDGSISKAEWDAPRPEGEHPPGGKPEGGKPEQK